MTQIKEKENNYSTLFYENYCRAIEEDIEKERDIEKKIKKKKKTLKMMVIE